ncbi:MAG: hypothetical protein ACD_15C00165G0002 [uncultured bacterium]|nr:MAG: hypothetical protein ACD_15C00165G0002 [uncultured bacterium]HCU70341.1 tRNA nucleotidyltransferase [Candidatus Moranbacteria bacterium]
MKQKIESHKEMKATDVVDLYIELGKMGIEIWIDGGWAVDALLGKQTRSHEDLDIAIEHKNIPRLRKYLESQGFIEIERDEEKKWDIVLGDDNGHEIDVHGFSFDDNGHIIKESHWAGYEEESLSGSGIINRIKVRCASFEQLLKTHDGTKRKLKEKDYKDMDALRMKFEKL